VTNKRILKNDKKRKEVYNKVFKMICLHICKTIMSANIYITRKSIYPQKSKNLFIENRKNDATLNALSTKE
jgi:hypothetical protein